MREFLARASDKAIEYSFYFLFFFVPFALTPLNYELFEYNKMMLTYGVAAVILGFWIIKMISQKQFKIGRTPLDIPIILFLTSQIVSTIISIDSHVSLWGYYSRFNGGLISTFSYFILYYAFVSNFPPAKTLRLFGFILSSGVLVSVYAVLEHFGIDKDIWVQDVQNRVFSSLGQPNWLAAYADILGFLSLGFFFWRLPHKKGVKALLFLIGFYLFYTTLIFTKSRSGFIGFWIVAAIFWIIQLIHMKVQTVKYFAVFLIGFALLTVIFKTPFEQINSYVDKVPCISLCQILRGQQIFQPNGLESIPTNTSTENTPSSQAGITDSGKIRQIVWKGAINIARANPWFGTGVETFAFSYYKFRPPEHNLTSEWDFLYNKAHNEYLNFAANTGLFGLGSYLFLIAIFIVWNIKILTSADPSRHNGTPQTAGQLALFTGWMTILITNFFGFSVVVIQLFFFLIPAISFVYWGVPNSFIYPTSLPDTKDKIQNAFSLFQYACTVIVLLALAYILLALSKMWYADTLFAKGHASSQSSDVLSAYRNISTAISFNPGEPLYYDELSFPAAEMAILFDENKETTSSSQLREQAIATSNLAITTSPNNVNFWKTRTRVFYALSQLDESYLTQAMEALEKAKSLSPTDPKIRYNIALLYDKLGKKQQAYDELIETTRLKSDFREGYYALAFFYDRDGKKDKAIENLQYILTHIATDDADAKKKLEELK